MPHLLDSLELRSVRLRNRIMLSPMCQYSADSSGNPVDWHLAHYGRMAMGGPGIVMLEATAISGEGRITYGDLGIWAEEHVAGLKRIAAFIRQQGAVPGIQLGHAGRKAATQRPWHGNGPLGDDDLTVRGEPRWQTVSSSDKPIGPEYVIPRQLDEASIAQVLQQWRNAARRAREAGFEIVEIHGAHGYLIHQFLSPLTNDRKDAYGGDLPQRLRFALDVVDSVRTEWPDDLPLFFRVSATDASRVGWSPADSVKLARLLKQRGVDVVDCSSGGIGPDYSALPRGAGCHVPFAESIKREAGIATVAVGLITEPEHADDIIARESADLVAIGREMLIDPNWPHHAREELASKAFDEWPVQAGWWLSRRKKPAAWK